MTAEATSKTQWKKILISTPACGIGMWIVGGLWHNLILPIFNKDIEAHHDGLGILLIAYFILAFLMAYLYSIIRSSSDSVPNGLMFGAIIGILWVFPHGLAMAGTHDTSIMYEIKNALYHVVEQGIGGIIISLIFKFSLKSSQ